MQGRKITARREENKRETIINTFLAFHPHLTEKAVEML